VGDRIVEIGIVRIDGDGVNGRQVRHAYQPDAGRRTDPRQGITQEDVAHAPTFVEALGDVLSGHAFPPERQCDWGAMSPFGHPLDTLQALALVPQQYGLAVVEAVTFVDHSHVIASATPDYVVTSAALYPISTTTRS
jgi:hypothetical protein